MKRGNKLAVIGLLTIVILVLAAILIALLNKKSNTGGSQSYTKPRSIQNSSSLNYSQAQTRALYEKDGVTFEHFWPLDAKTSNLKADESEIIVSNGGNQTVGFSSVGMDYFVAGSQIPHLSGTWEKFPTVQSWDRIEYINISPQYYKGERLVLNPGEKGKIHYHYQVQNDQSQNPDQKVRLNIAFTIGEAPYKLDQELVRQEPPTQSSNMQDDHGSGVEKTSNSQESEH